MAILDKDVKAIIDTKKDCTPFIATANVIIQEELVPLLSLSAARLDQILLYLAAHFVWNAESNGLVTSEINRSKETYRTFSDKSFGLATSRYGQTAIALDTTGTLSDLTADKGLPAKFKVFAQPQFRRRFW